MFSDAIAMEYAYAANEIIPGIPNIFFTLIFWAVLLFLVYRIVIRLRKRAPKNVGLNTGKKNPGLAAILSFVFMGSGQIYNGDFARGAVLIIIAIIFWGINFSFFMDSDINLAGLIPLLIIECSIGLWAIFDAYLTAKKINTVIANLEIEANKKCPYCAENIKKEAIVCRYCGKELAQTV